MSATTLRLARRDARATDSHKQRREADQVPARIAMPRIVFAVTAFGLVLFGLLMIYSSSSIIGLTGPEYGNDPAYFLIKQLMFVGAGTVLAIALAVFDYHRLTDGLLKVMWVVTVLLLLLVYTRAAGQETYGATRWIQIGSFTLQPSEFAKITILLVGARICEEYYGNGSLDAKQAIKLAGIGLVVPLILILRQPDKGTTGVLLLTLIVMCYLSGVSGRIIAAIAVVGLVCALAYAFKDDYARARILTVLDPFRDPFGEGYQLIQGLYAFGSGGITGVGLGFSRQKYNYLPMAHNDFIFAVIGEELGLLGTVGVLVAFGVLLWAGLKIAENAPDLTGRLIAAGCTSLIIIQLLLNVSGVVGIFPLSGKPVPFISYGGSSVLSCLLLVGLVMSVSIRSTLPETAHDRRRAQLRTTDEAFAEDSGLGFESDVGMPQPRSSRARQTTRGTGQTYAPALSWRIIDGERDVSQVPTKAPGRLVRDSRGRARIDLGPTAAQRLRDTRRDSSSSGRKR
ncbi:MAG: FtsW/RodA/SpoVE family cell cycle protein [Coriobacteriales bacterium]|nr:FtsW/RodA/SpoVE family cell cycle protein [Coriobacteriales bacterium]